MENSPEIHETRPNLQQLFKGALDEEYSAFFVCNDEFTAGFVEYAALDNSVGRADLLDQVAREAIDHQVAGQIRPFLYGGLAFLVGSQTEMADVTVNRIRENVTHWYIRLNRSDIAYLYTQKSAEPIERAYPISIRTSMPGN